MVNGNGTVTALDVQKARKAIDGLVTRTPSFIHPGSLTVSDAKPG